MIEEPFHEQAAHLLAQAINLLDEIGLNVPAAHAVNALLIVQQAQADLAKRPCGMRGRQKL